MRFCRREISWRRMMLSRDTLGLIKRKEFTQKPRLWQRTITRLLGNAINNAMRLIDSLEY
jgi:hypothetical protein